MATSNCVYFLFIIGRMLELLRMLRVIFYTNIKTVSQIMINRYHILTYLNLIIKPQHINHNHCVKSNNNILVSSIIDILNHKPDVFDESGVF